MGEIIDFQKFKDKRDEQLEKIMSVKMELQNVPLDSVTFFGIKGFLNGKIAEYNFLQDDLGSISLNIIQIKYGDFQEFKKMLREREIEYKFS